MIHIIYLCIAVLIYGLTRSLYYKKPELFLCLLIFINFEFFFLIPSIGKFDNYRVMLLPIIFFLIAELGLNRKLRGGTFALLVFSYLGLLVIGILTAFSNGQSLLLGVKAIKFQLPFFVYFILVSQDIDIERFASYLIMMSLLLVGLIALNLHVFNGNLFAKSSEELVRERLGMIRFTMGEKMLSIGCIMAFVKFLKKQPKFYLIFFLILFCHLFFVVQTRMIILSTILSCFMVFLLYREMDVRLAVFVIVIAFLTIPSAFLAGTMLTKVGLVDKTITDIREKGGSWQARVQTYKYYTSKIAESPFWGYGYENINWPKSPEPRLMERGIYKSDIGITHFFYENGMFGMVWFIAMIYGVVRMLWSCRREYPDILSYFLMAFFAMATLDFFFLSNEILLFGIFLGLLGQIASHYETERRNF